MNIKKLLRRIGMVLFIVSYLVVIYNVYEMKSTLKYSLQEVAFRVDNLSRITSNLISDILNINRVLYIYDLEFSELTNKLHPFSAKHIINTSVFVDGQMGVGSGTVIKKTKDNMYILTCYHVIDFIAQLNKDLNLDIPVVITYFIKDEFGTEIGKISYATKICYYDKDDDLALLKTFTVDDNLEVAEISNIEPQQGDTVYSVGNPLGEFIRTISKGILSNKINGYYVSDNTTTFGNSGGGLFNQEGQLIGVPALLFGYGTTKEDMLVPESSLGMSINLIKIKTFLLDLDKY